MAKIYRLDLEFDEDAYDRMAVALSRLVSFGWEEESRAGRWHVRIFNENVEYVRRLEQDLGSQCPQAAISLSSEEKTDWLASWKEFFTPVCCGNLFVVLPPWLAHEDFPGRKKIVIEPKSAFGTGHHTTTALCLEVLSGLIERNQLAPGRRFLDLGTGTGILGIACCHAGLSGVGLDIDHLAIDNARENVQINACKDFSVQQGEVSSVQHERFDLIVANILAQPLMEMAAQVVGCMKNGGILLLSGILESQADAVEQAYMARGLPKASRTVNAEWCALLWA